jgi:hypothetical protein
MVRRQALGRVVTILALVGAAVIAAGGCVLVPVPGPVVVAPRPPVVVAPPPVVIAPYGYYGYGWGRGPWRGW